MDHFLEKQRAESLGTHAFGVFRGVNQVGCAAQNFKLAGNAGKYSVSPGQRQVREFPPRVW